MTCAYITRELQICPNFKVTFLSENTFYVLLKNRADYQQLPIKELFLYDLIK